MTRYIFKGNTHTHKEKKMITKQLTPHRRKKPLLIEGQQLTPQKKEEKIMLKHKINTTQPTKPLRHSIVSLKENRGHPITYSEKYLKLIKKNNKEE